MRLPSSMRNFHHREAVARTSTQPVPTANPNPSQPTQPTSGRTATMEPNNVTAGISTHRLENPTGSISRSSQTVRSTSAPSSRSPQTDSLAIAPKLTSTGPAANTRHAQPATSAAHPDPAAPAQTSGISRMSPCSRIPASPTNPATARTAANQPYPSEDAGQTVGTTNPNPAAPTTAGVSNRIASSSSRPTKNTVNAGTIANASTCAEPATCPSAAAPITAAPANINPSHPPTGQNARPGQRVRPANAQAASPTQTTVS